MNLRGRSRRKRIADVLAVGAPIAVGLSIAMIPIRLVVEGDTGVMCGSVRDLIVRFVTGAMPVLDLGGIALGIAALALGARVKGWRSNVAATLCRRERRGDSSFALSVAS